MRPVAILLVWALGLCARAFPVWLLWTTPEDPAYLRHVPELLSSAQREILVALSDLRTYSDGTTDPLLLALRKAKERGAEVYVLIERGADAVAPGQREAEELLRSWGIAVRPDNPQVTLHAKFLVLDGRYVVVGSTHWTKSALTRSVQVDLVLDCPELAGIFRSFFFRLWDGRLEAQAQLPGTPWPAPAILPLLDLPETLVHTQALATLLAQAKKETLVLLYQVVYYPQYPDSPSTRLLGHLAWGASRGQRIRVLLEGGEGTPEVGDSNRLSGVWLYSQGADVRFDPVGIIMHAKALVMDGQHVVVTSANWTYAGLARNVEAGVLLFGVPELAAILAGKFHELWGRSRPLP
ncbi:MAG: phospholipase D-like domain-containing protein [Candidatus Bipolaricaulaceae bacterium]